MYRPGPIGEFNTPTQLSIVTDSDVDRFVRLYFLFFLNQRRDTTQCNTRNTSARDFFFQILHQILKSRAKAAKNAELSPSHEGFLHVFRDISIV